MPGYKRPARQASGALVFVSGGSLAFAKGFCHLLRSLTGPGGS